MSKHEADLLDLADVLFMAGLLAGERVDSVRYPYVPASQARLVADRHPEVRYVWWTARIAPGRHVVAWRLEMTP